MPRRLVFDRWIFFTTGLLVVAGLFMVGSASHYVAMSSGQNPSYFLVRHVIHAVLGLGLMLGAMHVPLRTFDDRRLLMLLVFASLAALVLVRTMPAAGGAHRWFRIGPVGIQPSEFVKMIVILALAHVLSRREEQINDFWRVLAPCGGLVAAICLLIAIQPDLGTAVMIAGAAGVMLFVAGLRWSTIGIGAAVAAVSFVAAVLAHPYRMQRIRTFLDPAADVQGAGFQLAQSVLAIGSGGIAGAGFGQGLQKAYYLPAAHTDFIFSVIGEELGLMGTLLLLFAVLVLFWRGLRAAERAPDRFTFYVALGCTSILVLQSLTHMGVCVGVLPTKGIPLPFVSYGGSSLMASMATAGLLLNTSQHSG